MNSYEIIKRAIEFKKPERIPLNFRGLGFEYSDTVWLDWLPPKEEWAPEEFLSSPGQEEQTWKDEWGSRWKQIRKEGGAQPITHPLENWDNLKDYIWPNPNDPKKYDKVIEKLTHAKDKYVLAGVGGGGAGWMSHQLRGFANWAQDFYLHPKELHFLIERVLDYQLGWLRNYSKFKGIHGIELPDDWGTQQAPFISVPMFREFYKPYYKKLFDAIHSYGWTTWMHSDGKIEDFIEELIDCGLDVWADFCQPRLFDIEKLGARYRGRICFEVSCDIQATLPKGDKQLIKEESELLLKSLATPEGGFMAEDYHTPSVIGVSLDIMKYSYEVYTQLGQMPRIK